MKHVHFFHNIRTLPQISKVRSFLNATKMLKDGNKSRRFFFGVGAEQTFFFGVGAERKRDFFWCWSGAVIFWGNWSGAPSRVRMFRAERSSNVF